MSSFHNALPARSTGSRRTVPSAFNGASINVPGSPCGVRRAYGAHRLVLSSRRRQLDQPVAIQPQQRHPAAHVLQAAVGLAPVERLAHPVAQLLAAGPGMRPQDAAHLFERRGVEYPPAVTFSARCRFHARRCTQSVLSCPAEIICGVISSAYRLSIPRLSIFTGRCATGTHDCRNYTINYRRCPPATHLKVVSRHHRPIADHYLRAPESDHLALSRCPMSPPTPATLRAAYRDAQPSPGSWAERAERVVIGIRAAAMDAGARKTLPSHM